MGIVFEEGPRDLSFTEFGIGEHSDDRHALSGTDQVEPEFPEEPGV